MSELRPHVTVNMAMSLDGRISTYKREQVALGTRHDRYLMDVLRAKADAVIVGAGTVRHDGHPILVRDDELRARRSAPHPVNVVMSRSLDLPSTKPFFTHPDTTRLIYTSRSVAEARMQRFRRLAEVVAFPRKNVSPSRVLEDLYRRGMRKVLMEGGGELHFAFAKEGVIDEIYITLTPKLIGGTTAPSILDGRGFLRADHIRLELLSNRRVGDELFLRYRVLR